MEQRKNQTVDIVIIHDAGADADDMAAIYYAATQIPNASITLVFGANADVEVDQSRTCLAEGALKVWAISQGLPWRVTDSITFNDFVSEGLECDYLFNISPWSAAADFSPELKQRISAGLPGVVVRQGVVSQGDYREERQPFNCDEFNEPFFDKNQDKLIAVPSAVCVGERMLLPNADFFQLIPRVMQHYMDLNAFKTLVSRAPAGLMRHFNVLGLCDESVGRGANYRQAEAFYNQCVGCDGDPLFEELAPSMQVDGLRLATIYVAECLLVRPRDFGLDTIQKIARMCASYAIAFSGIFDGRVRLISGLKASVECFEKEGLSEHFASFQEFASKDGVPGSIYPCMYDLIAAYVLQELVQKGPEAARRAIEMPRDEMLATIIEQLERGVAADASADALPPALGLFADGASGGEANDSGHVAKDGSGSLCP